MALPCTLFHSPGQKSAQALRTCEGPAGRESRSKTDKRDPLHHLVSLGTSAEFTANGQLTPVVAAKSVL